MAISRRMIFSLSILIFISWTLVRLNFKMKLSPPGPATTSSLPPPPPPPQLTKHLMNQGWFADQRSPPAAPVVDDEKKEPPAAPVVVVENGRPQKNFNAGLRLSPPADNDSFSLRQCSQGETEKPPQLLIFLHVFKTAGSTMRSLLKEVAAARSCGYTTIVGCADPDKPVDEKKCMLSKYSIGSHLTL